MERNTTLTAFLELLGNPAGIPSEQMLNTLEAEYPFFWLPAAITLKRAGNTLNDTTRQKLQATVALNASDNSTLFNLTTARGELFRNIYPPEPDNTPETTDAIDKFLDHYGKPSEKETELLERLIFNPVPDYASQLLHQEASDSEPDEDSIGEIATLAAGINATDESTDKTDTAAEDETDGEDTVTVQDLKPAGSGSTFSESLAKIYIRQGRYEKALEIIKSLNLNYPEKSIYFADQMRFLEKLIRNQSYN